MSVDLTNTGGRAGTEVVQLYLSDVYAALNRPVLEPQASAASSLPPARPETVEFTVPVSLLAFLDTEMKWLVEAGDVDVLLGASSDDIRLRDRLRIRSSAHIDGRTRGFFATAQARPVGRRRMTIRCVALLVPFPHPSQLFRGEPSMTKHPRGRRRPARLLPLLAGGLGLALSLTLAGPAGVATAAPPERHITRAPVQVTADCVTRRTPSQ